MTGGNERRLVADVGNVGTREARSLARQERAVELRVKLERTQVDVENLLALVDVGQPHLNLAVEPSGTRQRLVQNVDPVGGSQHDDARVGLEAVHLGQQLVERILALVVAREAGILAARPADGVDFVDEDDAGGLLLGLLEEVTHARSTHAHEHLHEVGAGDGEKRDVGFAGHSLGQQRLARSRRAYQKGSLRNLGAQLAVLVGLLEEVDDFHDFDLRLGQTGHILEGHALGVVLVEDLGLGLADVHDAAAGTAASASHRTHEENPHADDKHPRKDVHQNVGPVVALGLVYDRNLRSGALLDLLQILTEGVHRTDGEDELNALLGHVAVERLLRVVAVLFDGLLLEEDLGLLAVHHLDFLDLALFDHLFDGRPVARQRSVASAVEEVPSQNHHSDDSVNPHPRGTGHIHIGAFVPVLYVCHKIPLLFVFITRHRRIGPQLLQTVEAAQLGLEDMHHHVDIVHCNPEGVLLSLDAPDLFAQLLKHLLLHTGGDGRYLGGRVGVADHELRADGAVEARKVQRDDVLALLILDCADNGFNQFVHK